MEIIDFYQNQLCVNASWMFGEGQIMSQANYKKLVNKGTLNIVRRGGGYDNTALVAFNSIPERFRKLIEFKVGDPHRVTRHKMFTDRIETDMQARIFFSKYKLPDGRNLKPETQTEYVTNAEVLNACAAYVKNRKAQRRAIGGKTDNVWENVAEIVDEIKGQYPHTLPGNPRRLYDKFRTYQADGYPSLIHKNFCNDHSRKVNEQIENLILSLACLPEKPYTNTVADLYLQFLGGAIEVADTLTGEIFNPEDFKDRHGVPLVLSDSTIWNYLNLPKNRVIIDKLRNDSKYFNDHHRPHHHRTSPVYSLSKISLDDRDLPRKMPDGNRVKAYYAYDVASTAVIGAAYSRQKNTSLFVACVRDMFQYIERNGLMQPAEVEVEHHIVNQFADDMMRAGMLFQHVRWCAPGNSQEKRAEHFNRAKKYGYEKKYQAGIGRFTARLEANRPKQVGEWSGDGMRIKEAVYSFDELVADDRQTIEAYNNDLHPNQKLYKGKTRAQVLRQNQNPALQAVDKALLYRFIGNETRTTIRRNQYVRVNHMDYSLSTPYIIDNLEPGNLNVDAYWLPDAMGLVDEIFIYQNGLFIDKCTKITAYNEAAAERTEADELAITEQSKYVARFDKKVKDGRDKLHRIMIQKPAGVLPALETWENKSEDTVFEPATIETGFENASDFYAENAINSL